MSQVGAVADYGPFFTSMGVVASIAFTAIGAAYATAKSGVATLSVGVIRPELITKSIIPIVMGGIISIYGLIVCVVMISKYSSQNVLLVRHYKNFGAGLAVGLSGLASGIAIGIVGDAGVRGVAQQQRVFIGMILILIFAEVLGLYGLIVALIIVLGSD